MSVQSALGDVGDGADAPDRIEVAVRARDWAVEHGEDERLRIVYFGYDDAFTWPPGWTVHVWKAGGGYGNQAKSETARGRVNALRERIWFSPHCFPLSQQIGLGL